MPLGLIHDTVMLSGAKHLKMQESRILRPFAVFAAQGDVIRNRVDGEE